VQSVRGKAASLPRTSWLLTHAPGAQTSATQLPTIPYSDNSNVDL